MVRDGARRAWWGLWTVLAATALLVVVHAAHTAVFEIDRAEVPRELPRLQLAILGWVELGLSAVVVIGLALYASGEPRGRRWSAAAAAFAVLALALRLVPWWLLFATEEAAHILDGSRWAAYLAVALGGLALVRCLALAGNRNRAARRLVAAALVAEIAVQTAVVLFTPATSSGDHLAPSAIRHVLAVLAQARALGWLYLLADHLGGFPTPEGTPRAAIGSDRARATATAAGIAVVLAGTVLLSAAAWATERLGVDITGAEVTSGIALLLGGAAGLWRLQTRRFSLAGVLFAAIGLVIATRLVIAAAERPADQVALAPVSLPGLRISLPAGDTQRWADSLLVTTSHLELGTVEVGWSEGGSDPLDAAAEEVPPVPTVRFSAVNVPVPYRGLVWTLGDTANLLASWRCGADGRWFTLELSLYQPSPQRLRALGERVLSTARCD
jgi:hypothetical protein